MPLQLFVSYVDPKKGQAVSSQRLSRWVVEVIKLAYLLSKRLLPGSVAIHEGYGDINCLPLGILLEEVCRAATWASPHMFVKHYSLSR